MGRLRKIRFQKMVLLYSLSLLVIFVLIAVILIMNIRIDIPQQMQGYYVSIDGMRLTQQGFIIPWDELESRIVTEQEIQSLFAPYYMSAILRTTAIAFGISLLLSLGFSYVLTCRIVRPIEKTAAGHISFPRELSDIEAAFMAEREETSRLRADFENLSSYITHEQKNSLALLRAMIQNGHPVISERVMAQLDHMVRSLDNILTLSSNVGKLEKVDLLLVCGTAVDEYKKIYHDISFDFDEERSLTIAGNELMVYRAVSNLIENAIKYGQDGPIAVYVSAQRDCPYVSVRDQGIGIRMEQQEKIFESRYRIGNRKKDGYGIGLSLVRHVAELCGGFVWVESRENGGSEFKLIFPAFTLD